MVSYAVRIALGAASLAGATLVLTGCGLGMPTPANGANFQDLISPT